MGAILGLVFTLNLFSILGIEEIGGTPKIIILFASILTVVIFETALTLGIMLVMAWVTERVFRTYTSGFYWSFMAIVAIEVVLTILGQPARLLVPQYTIIQGQIANLYLAMKEDGMVLACQLYVSFF